MIRLTPGATLSEAIDHLAPDDKAPKRGKGDRRVLHVRAGSGGKEMTASDRQDLTLKQKKDLLGGIRMLVRNSLAERCPGLAGAEVDRLSVAAMCSVFPAPEFIESVEVRDLRKLLQA